MTHRAAVAASLAALVVAPAAATGAPPVCHLVTDAPHDHGYVFAETGEVISDSLDIRSADVAAGSAGVVVAIRVGSFDRWDPKAATGRSYAMAFTVGELHYTIKGFVGLDGASASGYVKGPGTYRLFDGTIALDESAKEVRLAVDTKVFGSPPIWRGRLIKDVTVASYLYAGPAQARVGGPVPVTVGQFGMSMPVDAATTKRTIRGGTPTCIRM